MAWKLLLESNAGLAALAVILFTIIIGYGYLWFFDKMAKDEAASQNKS